LEVQVDEVDSEKDDAGTSTKLEETFEGIIFGVRGMLWVLGAKQLSQLRVSSVFGISSKVGAVVCAEKRASKRRLSWNSGCSHRQRG
jgi:hypothetical protein